MYTGGAEEAVLQLVCQLAKRNVLCDIAVGKVFNKAILKKFSLPDECHIHHIPPLLRNPNPWKDLQAYRALRALLRKNKYSIVNTHTAKAGILGRYAAHKEKVPVIIHTVHGVTFGAAFSAPLRKLYAFFERWAAGFTTHFIFVAGDLLNAYTRAKIASRKKSSIIYIGMDLAPFRAAARQDPALRLAQRKELGLSNNPEERVLACIGRITPTKNQKTLLRLFPELLAGYPELQMLLIGSADAQYHKELLALCDALNIADRVHFLGYRTELWKILPAIDIHCLASQHEGLPLILVQSSAAGIPSVCFRCSGVDEIVAHKKSGYVFEHTETEQFLASLLMLIRDTALRERFSRAAAQQSRGNSISNWDLDSYADKTKEIYTQLLQQATLIK